MLYQVFDGFVLVSMTVAIHSIALAYSLRSLKPTNAHSKGAFAAAVWLLARLAIIVILAHMIEVSIWGAYYHWRAIFPGDIEKSIYFSAVTYATIGYGDILPPPQWRLFAAMEGLTGILMCGWSGGYFFAVVQRIHQSWSLADSKFIPAVNTPRHPHP